MTKKKKITLIVVGLVFLTLVAAVLIYYFGATHPYYNSIKKAEFQIPGLNEKFVPQGFDYDESSSNYFITGYMANENPGRIYFLHEDTPHEYKYVTITIDGEDHVGHMGGVAIGTNYVWVASDKLVYRLNKSDILNAENKAEIEVVDYFTPGNGADSITIYDNKLWVGEFYMKEKYETPVAHHLEVEDGETNRAIAYCYEIDETKEFGIDSLTPIAGLSLPNKAQGFDFTQDGKVIVSTSYSIPDSHILVYENALIDDNKVNVELDNETTIPVYKLSSSKLTMDIEAPSMSEEVVVKDERVYILFESACSKYKFVNRTRVDNVQSITLETKEN